MTAPKQRYYESEGGCVATSHFPGWATSTFIEEEKCTRHDPECSHLGFPQENMQEEMGKNTSLILSSSSIQRAPPLLDPCCVGGDLEGGGSSGGRLQRGRGRGGQVWGKGGGLAAKKREKGGRPLGFCGRKKRRLICLMTLHPTAHNPFPHPRTEDQLLVNIFLGYYITRLSKHKSHTNILQRNFITKFYKLQQVLLYVYRSDYNSDSKK